MTRQHHCRILYTDQTLPDVLVNDLVLMARGSLSVHYRHFQSKHQLYFIDLFLFCFFSYDVTNLTFYPFLVFFNTCYLG